MGLGSSSAHAYTVATHDAAATVDETPSKKKIGQLFQQAVLPSPTVDPLTKVVRQNNPIEWWRQNCTRFPLLSVLAAQYMAAPRTSVASERLFSTAGDVLSDSRSRLLPDKAEQLIFLKINLPLLH